MVYLIHLRINQELNLKQDQISVKVIFLWISALGESARYEPMDTNKTINDGKIDKRSSQHWSLNYFISINEVQCRRLLHDIKKSISRNTYFEKKQKKLLLDQCIVASNTLTGDK